MAVAAAIATAASLAAAPVPPPELVVENWMTINSVPQSGSGSGVFVGGLTPDLAVVSTNSSTSVIDTALHLVSGGRCVFEALPEGAYYTTAAGTVQIGHVEIVDISGPCGKRTFQSSATVTDDGLQWVDQSVATTPQSGLDLSKPVSTTSHGGRTLDVRQTVPFYEATTGLHGLGSQLALHFEIRVLDETQPYGTKIESRVCLEGTALQTTTGTFTFKETFCRN